MKSTDFWNRVIDLNGGKLNYSEFARIMHVAQTSAYHMFEREQLPKLESAYNLAKHYGVTIEYLLTGESSYDEFLPYLAKADEATLSSIRKLLDMPAEVKKSASVYITEAIS